MLFSLRKPRRCSFSCRQRQAVWSIATASTRFIIKMTWPNQPTRHGCEYITRWANDQSQDESTETWNSWHIHRYANDLQGQRVQHRDELRVCMSVMSIGYGLNAMWVVATLLFTASMQTRAFAMQCNANIFANHLTILAIAKSCHAVSLVSRFIYVERTG